MKRPFSNKRPIGPFAQRPLVENDMERSDSKCFKKLCLNGHSIEEFLDSLESAYEVYKVGAKHVWERNGFEVDNIWICGSTVSEDIGLRHEKILKIRTDQAVFSEDLDLSISDVERMLDNSDNNCEFIDKLRAELDNPRELKNPENIDLAQEELEPEEARKLGKEVVTAEEALLNIAKVDSCSDIDMVTQLKQFEGHGSNATEPLMRDLRAEAEIPAEKELLGIMRIESHAIGSTQKPSEECLKDIEQIKTAMRESDIMRGIK